MANGDEQATLLKFTGDASEVRRAAVALAELRALRGVPDHRRVAAEWRLHCLSTFWADEKAAEYRKRSAVMVATVNRLRASHPRRRVSRSRLAEWERRFEARGVRGLFDAGRDFGKYRLVVADSDGAGGPGTAPAEVYQKAAEALAAAAQSLATAARAMAGLVGRKSRPRGQSRRRPGRHGVARQPKGRVK